MIELYSNSGTLKFDTLLKNASVAVSGSFTMVSVATYLTREESAFNATQYTSDLGETFVNDSFFLNDIFQSPVIFFRAPIGKWASLTSIVRYPANAQFPARIGFSFRANPSTVIQYKVFEAFQLLPVVSNYGFQAYDTNGVINYHSDIDSLSIVSELRYLENGQVRVGYTPTQYTVPAFSAYGGGLLYFYGNDLIYTDCDNNSDAFGSLRSIAVRNDSATQYSVRMMQVSSQSFFSIPVFSRPRYVYRSR